MLFLLSETKLSVYKKEKKNMVGSPSVVYETLQGLFGP